MNKSEPRGPRGRRAADGKTSAEDVWSQVHKRQAAELKGKWASMVEPNVVVIGGKGAGKTTIVQTFVFREGGAGRSGGDSAPEPTTSLDYRYLRTGFRASSDFKQTITHVWELGGERALSRLLDIAVNTDTVQKTGIVIVADLSRPKETLSDVHFWLAAAKRRVTDILDKLKNKKPKVPFEMAARARGRLGASHPDLAALEGQICAVPILIVANKFDQFKSTSVEKLRVVARTLRAIAHCAGAGIVYVDKTDGASRQSLLAHLSRIQRMQRGVIDRKKDASMIPQTKDIQKLSISFGQDSLADIGPASVIPTVSPQTMLDEWTQQYRKHFPASKGNDACGDSKASVHLDAEASVDAVLQQMNIQAKQAARGAALKKKLQLSSRKN
eukprot:CAMPEP_0197523750 /NCGR_PEP_ID=MMETSP1318-20131121/8622_1 /TAXON_ID=552666 /ORGANISM="Partenskyella glossopodia, Strain RCC365" /LENGTH=384 /DNA_ID=CAMNT_0043076541 /DNA_START=25 /DNA_END=1179 /DNA_ORIENTATION=+